MRASCAGCPHGTRTRTPEAGACACPAKQSKVDILPTLQGGGGINVAEVRNDAPWTTDWGIRMLGRLPEEAG